MYSTTDGVEGDGAGPDGVASETSDSNSSAVTCESSQSNSSMYSAVKLEEHLKYCWLGSFFLFMLLFHF